MRAFCPLQGIKVCVGGYCLCYFFVILAQTRFTWEEGHSVGRTHPSDWPVNKSGGTFLTDGQCGRIQLTVGGATPVQVG